MTSKSDYYELLGVDADASEDEVLAAYRAKIRSVHPDLGPASEFEQRNANAALLNEARAVLCDPVLRAKYDATRVRQPWSGHTAESAPSGASATRSARQSGGQAYTPPRPPRPPSAGTGPSQTTWRSTRDRTYAGDYFVDSDFGTPDEDPRFRRPSHSAAGSAVQSAARFMTLLLVIMLRLLASPVGLYLLIVLVAVIMYHQALR